jgi:FKBP-type peptidyl-prolyl cis-trans isomerase SlyD
LEIFVEDGMKKLFGLLVMSGATLGAMFFLTTLVRTGGGPAAPAITLKPASIIEEGSIVSIEYTLTDETGTELDSNVGKEPLTFIQGAGQIVRGLEKELIGLKTGDRKTVQVKPEDGYGMPSKEAFQEFPRETLPAEAQKVGAALMVQGPDGRAIPIRVHEIRGETVVVDFNHPLAGKTLNFDVTIKDIRSADTR